jgi:hypothetical protein
MMSVLHVSECLLDVSPLPEVLLVNLVLNKFVRPRGRFPSVASSVKELPNILAIVRPLSELVLLLYRENEGEGGRTLLSGVPMLL